MFRGHTRHGTAHRKEACDLVPNPDETMESFRTEIQKALWHSYNMLDKSSNEQVHISQLKVITSNIGLKLGFDKSEEILDKEGLKSMDYHTYFETVKSDLLDKVDDSGENTEKTVGERLNDVIQTCWTFCSFHRAKTVASALTSEHCLKLWRLFNFLAEIDDDNKPVIPVKLDREEAAILFNDFIDRTGQRNKQTVLSEFTKDTTDTNVTLSFTEFQQVFELSFVEGLTENDITMAINSIYGTYILDELAKGTMFKRGYKVKSWKERWLTLTSARLNYYVNPSERVLKGCIEIDKDCSIEVPPDRPGQKQNRFILQTAKKPYEMSASHPKTKNEWVSAIQCALSRVGMETTLQQQATQIRSRARKQKRLLADEEGRKRLADAELLRTREDELDEEKKRRTEAEFQLHEEQRLREAEQERLRELEEIKRELERLLEEERQAKRDEEIVRNLQARLLEDEFQKREELERLKKLQEEMLQTERDERADLESERQEQERALRDAQFKLEQLERDKAAAADRMQEAVGKLQKAEKDRHIMEEKVKLWKTPVGLARPILPHADPQVTHRGQGAFCDLDFKKRMKDRQERSESPVMFKEATTGTALNNVTVEDEVSNSNTGFDIGVVSRITEERQELAEHNAKFETQDTSKNETKTEIVMESNANAKEQYQVTSHQLQDEPDIGKLSVEESDNENRHSFESNSTTEESIPIYDTPKDNIEVSYDENRESFESDSSPIYDAPKGGRICSEFENEDGSSPIYDVPKGDGSVETSELDTTIGNNTKREDAHVDDSETNVGDKTEKCGQKLRSDDVYETVAFP